jgi:hypothetical protein
MTAVLIIAAIASIVVLLTDARREDRRNAAQLQGIELRADTTRRDEVRQALRATGGGSW